jgi:hypothetical protein
LTHVTLIRFAYLPDVTLGHLHVAHLQLATVERPWLANAAGPGGRLRLSCVPDGLYNVRPHESERFPGTYALINEALGVYYQPSDIPAGQAWGRSAILIHRGNVVEDVVGCIAIGMSHVGHGVGRSGMALDRLRSVIGRKPAVLQIRPTAGTSEV